MDEKKAVCGCCREYRVQEQKPEFCTEKNCILIDDFKKNIEAWESFGGTGIHHTSAEETISKLREPGNEARNEAVSHITKPKKKALRKWKYLF